MPASPSHRSSERGFSLLELIIAVGILTIVSGVTLEGVFRLSRVNQTVSNRTEMHSGVRNATELLQQEVGQAGRIALPNLVRLGTAIPTSPQSATVTIKAVDAAGNLLASVNGTDGMFVGEKLVVDTGANEETVTISSIDSANKQITATFNTPHASDVPITVYGGFAYGVVPTGVTNGSSGSVLKMVGDFNSDGTLRYIEYTCDTASGNLYRRTVAFDAATKPAITPDMSLLNNITPNPDNTPCFTYQVKNGQNNVPFVVDVAITLTVQTPDKDPLTGLYQKETKALLNVSPRNVFNVWQLDAGGISNRVQPLPPTVTTLMGLP